LASDISILSNKTYGEKPASSQKERFPYFEPNLNRETREKVKRGRLRGQIRKMKVIEGLKRGLIGVHNDGLQDL
jgi:hypothetical protein